MIENQNIAIIISLFSLGLFGSFTHCIGMCGPFVLTQVSNRLSDININQSSSFKRLSSVSLLPYHLGRITTYCIIGALSSIFTSSFKNLIEFKFISALMLIIASIIFVKVTLPNLKIRLPIKINLIEKLHIFRLSKKFISKTFKGLFLKPYNFRGYILGLLLGFIPCGLLYAAVIAASAMDNFLNAALAMFCFGIATIPGLFITASGGYLFFQKYRKNLQSLTRVILLINSITLFIIAIGLIFNKI